MLVFACGPARAILKCAVVATATATAAESLVRRSGAGAEGVAVAHVARRTRLQTWLAEVGGLGVGAGVGWSAQVWNSIRGRGFGAGRSIESRGHGWKEDVLAGDRTTCLHDYTHGFANAERVHGILGGCRWVLVRMCTRPAQAATPCDRLKRL